MVKAVLLAVCLASAWSSVNAGPAEDALAIVERWTAAAAAIDVDALVALYTPDAVLIGTGSTTLAGTPADIRAYFEQGLRGRGPVRIAVDEHRTTVLSEEVVVITGLDTLTAGVDPIITRGRVTFVIVRRDDGWRIAHFHRSTMPG